MTVSSNTLTVGGPINGSGFSLTKAGSGTLVLGGSNSYSGGTIINAGNLIFTSTAAIPTGTQNITINSGGALDVTVTGAYTTVSGWLGSGKINTASAGALALTAGSSTETISMTAYSSLFWGPPPRPTIAAR